LVGVEYVPIASTASAMRIVIAPNGRASFCNLLWEGVNDVPLLVIWEDMLNSWTRATPVDAMARLVRTYAKNVRSEARWSLATLPWFCSLKAGVSLLRNGRALLLSFSELRWASGG